MKFIPGNYQFEIKKKKIILYGPLEADSDSGKYPDWRKLIMTDIKKCASLNFNGVGISKDIEIMGLMSLRFYRLIKSTEKIINLLYLNDLTKETWDVYLYCGPEANRPVMFKKESKKELVALIMPMTPENE
jgi:hypothetical protein